MSAAKSTRTAGPKRAAWSQVTARVREQRDYAEGFRWLDLDVPSSFGEPVAGQFVQLLLESPSPVLLPRPMSVAGVTRRGAKTTIGFLYAPVGAGTRVLASLEPGETVRITGPLGQGFPLDEPGTPVLIAGGRGLAPLLMAAEALAKRKRSCEFVFGARNKSLLIGLNVAKEVLAKRGGRLHLCTDDGSRGLHGNVIDVLDEISPKLQAPLVIHACGPHGMLGAIARWALANGARAHLAMESVMACGTGVCRGCPLPRSAEARDRVLATGDAASALQGNPEWAMCCTDGPVFEARELDWDRVE